MGGGLEPSYEGIIDKVKNVGSTIWGWLKKIWETITNKLGELGKKIKKAWESVKNFIKNRGNKSIEEEDEEDNLSTSTSNKFAKGRGKNINRRKIHNREDDDNSVASLPEPEKTSRYKSPKLKGGKVTATAAGNKPRTRIVRAGSGTNYNAIFHPDGSLNRELNVAMKLLLKVATQINVKSKWYKELLSVYSAEAKIGDKVGDAEDLEEKTNKMLQNLPTNDEDIDDYLNDLENKISNKGYIRLSSKIPGVEKYYQMIYTSISKLQQSTGVILNQINKKLGEFKSKHSKYEFTAKNSNGINMEYIRFKGSKSGSDIHKSILDNTKKLSSLYSRIISITSKMIISPSK